MTYNATDASFFQKASCYLASQQTMYTTNLTAIIRSTMDGAVGSNQSSVVIDLSVFPSYPQTQDMDLTATLQQLGYLVTFSGTTYTIDWTAPTA